MGTEVKLLFKQLDSLSALCAISSISPPPISCAVNKICRVDFPCACGKCVPFRRHSFRSVSYLDRTNTSFCLHCKHTPQHRTASGNTHFHFASFIHSVFPKPISHAFPMVCFSFLQRVCPINRLKAERKVITPYRCVVVRSANIRATIRLHHPLVVQ